MEAATSPIASSVAGEVRKSPSEPRLNSDLIYGNHRTGDSETEPEKNISRSSNTTSALQPYTSPGGDKAIEETQVAQQNNDAAITTNCDDMNFKPFILTPIFLIGSLLFHFLVLGMLIALALNPEFTVLSEWGYFFVQILPPTIGTITASFLRGVTLALSRLEPFIQCASNSGSTAGPLALVNLFVIFADPLDHVLDGTVPDHHQAPSMPALRESGPGVNENPALTSSILVAEEIERMSYRAVYANMKPAAMLSWTALAIIFIGLYIAALACGMVSGIQLPFSPEVASFLFSFLPTFIMSLYTWFWEDVDMFFRSTQPFAGLSYRKPAAENLLLDYNCLLPGLVTYTALKNQHRKVAGASVMALLQRLLPIIVAGSLSTQWHNAGSVVFASLPLTITTIVWLVAYVFLIPVFLTGNSDRYLPRNYLSISDLISWTYASKLLRDDHSDPSDPLLRSNNPLDVGVFGPESKQWHAEARLRLAKKEYAFWMYKSTTHPGKYCLGIDETSNMEAIPPQTQPEVGPKVLGMRRRNKKKPDEEKAVTRAKDYLTMRNPNLELL
ncbi:hypothetical protein DL95DRAFT_469894 [Leptodontidium sp. 2 PMI_412]|nr:hypothetical protein DL95DRAFT_469894 [Leptodontidium sp. 2 PMI_412]